MRRYGLRNNQWGRIEAFLPGCKGRVGVTAADNRLFVEAVLCRHRAGMPWRDLPEHFGDSKNVYRRFSRWANPGVSEQVSLHLAASGDDKYAIVDSAAMCAHPHSAGARKKTAPTKRSGARAAD